jgi:hypothetical protein
LICHIGIYPLPEGTVDACQHLLYNSCPITAGEHVFHNFTLLTLEEYPAETFIICELSLRNSANEVIVCFDADYVIM